MAEPSVQLYVEERNIEQNETLLVSVLVQQAKESTAPVFPQNDAFRLIKSYPPSTQRQSSTRVINGKIQKQTLNQTIYSFLLAPQQEGRLEVPAFSVKADGKTYHTSPLTIQVGKGAAIPLFFFECEIPPAPHFVGQPFLTTWRIWIGRDISNIALDIPWLLQKDFRFLEYSPQLSKEQANKASLQPIWENSSQKQLPVLMELGTRNGEKMPVLTLTIPVIPHKAGTYAIPRATAYCAYRANETKSRRLSSSDLWDDMDMLPFSLMEKSREKNVHFQTSDQPPLVIQELPQVGKPDDFSGLIGKPEITAAATPTECSLGEPVLYSLSISCPAFPDYVHLPSFSKNADLTRDFRVLEDAPPTIQGNNKVFQCTLRARNAGISCIPPLEIPYFDPEKQQYLRLKIPSIPIKVHPAPTLEIPDADANTRETGEPTTEIKARENSGLHQDDTDISLLCYTACGPASWGPPRWKFWVLLLPPLIYGLAILRLTLRRSREKHPADFLRAKKTLEQFCRGKLLPPPQQLQETLWQYLRGLLNLPAGVITRDDITAAIAAKNPPENLAEDLQRLLQALDAARFAGTPVNLQEYQNTLRQLLLLK